MLDTMTFTKTVGALCGALLVFLLGNWAAESLYHTEVKTASYTIDTGATEAPAVEEPAVDFNALLASADPAAGERLWRQCAACHALEQGKNGTGPYLYGVVGRPIGAAQGYAYSAVLAGHGDVWTPENLSGFIENPRSWAPGTKMSYAGMRNAQDRANLIVYLASFGGTLPEPAEAPAAEEPAAEQPAAEAAPAGQAAPEAPAADEQPAPEQPAAEEPAAGDGAQAPAPAGQPAAETAEAPSAEQPAAAAPALETAQPAAADQPAAETAEAPAPAADAPAAAPAAAEPTAITVAGDPAAGEREFAKCRACHAVVAPDGTVIQRGAATGPNLYGVIGRQAGTVEGFRYGPGLREAGEMGLVWTPENFVAYVADPTAFIREFTGDQAVRSNMAFKLGKGVEDIAAYLHSVSQP